MAANSVLLGADQKGSALSSCFFLDSAATHRKVALVIAADVIVVVVNLQTQMKGWSHSEATSLLTQASFQCLSASVVVTVPWYPQATSMQPKLIRSLVESLRDYCL